jgi:phosphomannomutase
MTSLDQIFKAYDIRALVPEQLNAELARQVGGAFAAFAKSPTILVGMDMRPSGKELVAAFSDGVTAAGVDVVLLGLVSTDELFYATGALDAPGAMFTASHNPAQYNGIKLCLQGAKPVGSESGLVEIRRMVETGDVPTVPRNGAR